MYHRPAPLDGNATEEEEANWVRIANCADSSCADISMLTVRETLLKLEAEDTNMFMLNCALERFRQRYAPEGDAKGDPFKNAEELRPGNPEWQRVLLLPHKGQRRVPLLCCPEDVERDPSCTHDDTELCERCKIPLCARCRGAMRRRKAIPMGLCNDNFWGYTTDIITKYRVRWIELAIVSPCWTTMLV